MHEARRVHRLLSDLEHEIAYYAHCQLRGYSVQKQEKGWLLVLKVFDRQGEAMVAFVSSSSYGGLWELVATALYTTGHQLKWKKDRYFKKKFDYRRVS